MIFILSHVCQQSGELVKKTVTLNQLRKGVPPEECFCPGLKVELGEGTPTEDEAWLFRRYQEYLGDHRKSREALARAIQDGNDRLRERADLEEFRAEVSKMSVVGALDCLIKWASSAGYYDDSDAKEDTRVQIVREHLLNLTERRKP